MVTRKPVLKAASGFSVTIVIIALAIIGGVFFYFDPAPSPVGPICKPNEIKILADREWWCVLARKP